jgi:stress response protein YsnF
MDRKEPIESWIGQRLVDREGAVVGHIREIYLDDVTREPKWAQLDVPERPPGSTFVPLVGAERVDDGVRMVVTRDQVLAAPEAVPTEGRITPDQEGDLDRHYRRREDAVWQEPVRTVADPVTVDEAPEMIRAEEELVIDTRPVARERVRFVKRVVTETVTRTYELRREELHVARTPDGGEQPAVAGTARAGGGDTEHGDHSKGTGLITGRVRAGLDAVRSRTRDIGSRLRGEPFSEEQFDLVLYEEQITVSKRVVPRERVRLRKIVASDQREHTETLLKEQVTLEKRATSPRLDENARQLDA